MEWKGLPDMHYLGVPTIMPLNNYIPCMNITQETNEIELITSYFQQGITNLEMVEFLKLHGIEMSLSTLKRRV